METIVDGFLKHFMTFSRKVNINTDANYALPYATK